MNSKKNIVPTCHTTAGRKQEIYNRRMAAEQAVLAVVDAERKTVVGIMENYAVVSVFTDSSYVRCRYIGVYRVHKQWHTDNKRLAFCVSAMLNAIGCYHGNSVFMKYALKLLA